MKKTMALILALGLALLCCAASAEGTAGRSPIHGARYFFEHQMIPQLFYDDPQAMIDSMKKSGPFDLWSRFTKQNGIDVTYSAEDFDVKEIPQDDGTEMVVLSLPVPPDTPLCFRIYLCYDPASKTGMLFTAEYDNMFGEDCLLCGWSADGRHMNYGGGLLLSREDPDYEAGLLKEAAEVHRLMREQVPAGAAFDPGDGSVSAP